MAPVLISLAKVGKVVKAAWMISKVKPKLKIFSRKRATLAVVMAGVAGLTQLLPSAAPANAQTIANAKAQAAAIAARLDSLGAQASRSLQNYNQAQTSLLQVNQKIKITQSQIAQTQVEVTSLKSKLTKEAINDYMTGGNLTSLYVLFNDNPTQATVRQEFINTVTNSQADLVATNQAALQNLHIQQASLNTLQQRAVTVLNQMTVAKNSALLTIGQEKSQLNSVDASIASLVAQQQAALAQQAAARARQIIASSSSNSFSVPSSPSGYANPLRAISALSPERIDQGVDYHGYGPIYAIGTGVVLSVFNGGWPGGTFITYRLSQGPAAGLVVYAAEDIKSYVQIGQNVDSSTIIGTMYEGFDGIETGWADPTSSGETMARHFGQFGGSNSTQFGYNFSQLLRSVGSPGGILQNPPTGTLLPGWPIW